MFAKASRPVMCPATGFHADEHGGQWGDKGYQGMAGQALAQDDLAPLIHSHHVKHALCNVDPEYAHLWFHGSRLLWLYGFTDRELIVAHRSRSAQGRGHFITTFSRGSPTCTIPSPISADLSLPGSLAWERKCGAYR